MAAVDFWFTEPPGPHLPTLPAPKAVEKRDQHGGVWLELDHGDGRVSRRYLATVDEFSTRGAPASSRGIVRVETIDAVSVARARAEFEAEYAPWQVLLAPAAAKGLREVPHDVFEQGGGLFGRVRGRTIEIFQGVEASTNNSKFHMPMDWDRINAATRYHEARHGWRRLGTWHSHGTGSLTEPSPADLKGWVSDLYALGGDLVVGAIAHRSRPSSDPLKPFDRVRCYVTERRCGKLDVQCVEAKRRRGSMSESEHLVATTTCVLHGVQVIRGITQLAPDHQWARNRYPMFVPCDSDEGRAAIREAGLGLEAEAETAA